MPTNETTVTNDMNYEIQAYNDWAAAHTGSINAQATVAPALANEANKLSTLTGSLMKTFSDATLVVANRLLACSQDPRALLEPIFNAILPPPTGSI